jgi:hypothetical protein
MVEANHTAVKNSSGWKVIGGDYGGRETRTVDNELYIKALTSDYWYKASELESWYSGGMVPWEYNRIHEGQ